MPEWQSIVASVCDASQPSIEVNGSQAVQRCGGSVVLPQHFDQAGALQRYDLIESVPEWLSQVVIHVEKSRQASLEAAQYAWTRMPVGGRLLLCGPNELGIKSTAKQLEVGLRHQGELLINKRRARVVAFEKSEAAAQVTPTEISWNSVALDEDETASIFTRYGVFSADHLDDATALLQDVLFRIEEQPRQLLDMACGSGHLGLFGLRLWPTAKAWFIDADARALTCVRKNLEHLSLTDRAQVAWWSAGSPIPEKNFDCVLINPPAHQGKQNDHDIALRMFEQAFSVMSDGATMYIVANKQLPYERSLRQLCDQVACVCEEAVFKILKVEK